MSQQDRKRHRDGTDLDDSTRRGGSRRPRSPLRRWNARADVCPTLRTWTVGAAIVRPLAAAPPRVSIRWLTKQGHTVVAPPSAQRLDSPSSHAPE